MCQVGWHVVDEHGESWGKVTRLFTDCKSGRVQRVELNTHFVFKKFRFTHVFLIESNGVVWSTLFNGYFTLQEAS